MEKEASEALTDLLSGIEGGEVGGIFLLEKSGLVLQSLIGSVEAVIAFIEGLDQKGLLAKPSVYEKEAESEYLWASVPLIVNGIRGTIVVASTSSDGQRCLSFLKKALPHIVRVMEGSCIKRPVEQVPSKDLLLQKAELGKVRD
jgi:hypothetical protein